MTTMDEKYGDGSQCIACDECGYCKTCGDCETYGCGKRKRMLEHIPIYYESHITIDPTEDLELLKELCKPYKYKVAQLFMKKGETLEPSDIDQFMTGHGKTFTDLQRRQSWLVATLNLRGFKVRRYKIEAVIQDSRYDKDSSNSGAVEGAIQDSSQEQQT